VPQAQLDENWKDTWCQYICEHASRLGQRKIRTIRLLPCEFRRLIGEQRYGHRAAQYTAWRSSLLAVGAFFFAATVALDILFLADPWQSGSSGSKLFILQYVAERYHKFFDDLLLMNQLYAILLLVFSVFSVIAGLYSSWRCSTQRISKRASALSFTCSYMPPFLLLLCIPFRHGVDFEGIQRQMCQDVLNFTESASNEIYGRRSGKWPRRSSNLADVLVKTYGIELPNDFCDQDPTDWGAIITKMLEDGGFMEENGTCPRAESQVQDLVKVSATASLSAGGVNVSGSVGESIAANAGTAAAAGAEMAVEASARAAQLQSSMANHSGTNSTCGSSCWNCTTTCLPYLGQLASLSSVYDLKIIASQWLQDAEWEQLATGASTVATAAITGAASLSSQSASQMVSDTAVKTFHSARHKLAAMCSHCFSWEAGLRCAWECDEVREAVARAAMVGDVAKETRMCVKPEDMTSFTLLAELGTQTGYWKMLLGAVFAFLSFGELLPLTFSLLFGAAKGSSIAKSVIPYSRLPDVISSAAAIFTFPFIFVIVVLIQSVIGTPLTLVGVLLMLGGIVASMQPGKLQADHHSVIEKRQGLTSNISIACFVLSLIFFIIALVMSSLARSVFRNLRDQGIELTEEDKKAIGSQFTWFVIRMGFIFLGKSLISTVFFSDGAVTLMDKFHWNDDRDPLAYQCARMRLVEDMHTLAEEESSDEGPSSAVHPESEDDHSAAQAVHDNEAVQKAAVSALQALIRLQQANGHNGRQGFSKEEEDALIAAKTLPELLRVVASGPLGQAASASEPTDAVSGVSSAPAIVSGGNDQASMRRDSRTVLNWFQRNFAKNQDSITPM